MKQLDLFIETRSSRKRSTPAPPSSESATDTRDSAYHKIQGERVSRARAQVLAVIQMHDGVSNSEIAYVLGWGVNRVTGRVKELRERNKVVRHIRRECKVTGETVWTWKAVSN